MLWDCLGGAFLGNSVAAKWSKKVHRIVDTMDEFAKDVSMQAEFRCDEIVHFDGCA